MFLLRYIKHQLVCFARKLVGFALVLNFPLFYLSWKFSGGKGNLPLVDLQIDKYEEVCSFSPRKGFQ